MPVLLLLIMPFVEIYVLIQVGARFGIVNTIFALLSIAVVGAGLAKAQGRYILQRLQTSLARGEAPTDQALHGVLVFVAGLLFLIPGFVSDLVALLLVLPGTRHLMVKWVGGRLRRGMTNGNFKVFSTGFGAGFGTSGPRHPQSPDRQARDVTPKVIDVTPVSSHTRTESKRDDAPE